MRSIVFGDSISRAENCPPMSSFVYKLDPLDYTENHAISGTTIGEYSIYPVDGMSLQSMYPKVNDLHTYDTIYLEYGVNDISAVMCGFTTLQSVIVSFVKALDGIKQINDHAKIKFLVISLDHDIINKHSQLQCDYLKNDYFKDYDFDFPTGICTRLYEDFIKAVSKRVEVIPMIEDISFFDTYISDDNLHPNKKGHEIIANTIRKYI